MSMGAVLLTRPQPDSEALAAVLAQHGITAIISPVIHIEPLQSTIPSAGYDGLILTSRHAIGAAKHRAEPCYVVGSATAAAAQEAGLKVAVSAPTAKDLTASLLPHKRYLYLAGEHISDDFSGSGATVSRVTVYRAVATKALGEEASSALANGAISHVAFYSARSARLFGELAKAVGALPIACCISEQVSQSARSAGNWKDVLVAAQPDGDAMLQLLLQAK